MSIAQCAVHHLYKQHACEMLIPNSRACWVSIPAAGAESRGLAALKIRNGTLKRWNVETSGTLELLEPWNHGTLSNRILMFEPGPGKFNANARRKMY